MNVGSWSASDDVPSSLFGFGADAWPAVFFVSHEVFCTLDVGDDVGSFRLEGGSTGSDGHFDIGGTFDNQGFSAVSVEDGWNFHFGGLWGLRLWGGVVGSKKQSSGNEGGKGNGESFGHM